MKRVVAKLKKKVEMLKKEGAALNKKMEALEKEGAALNKKVEALEEEEEALNRKVEALEEKGAALKQEEETLNRKVSERFPSEEGSKKKMKILCWDDVETENIPSGITDICQVEHLERQSQLSGDEIWEEFATETSSPILLYLPTDIIPDVMRSYIEQQHKTHEMKKGPTGISHSGSSKPSGRSDDPSPHTPMDYRTTYNDTYSMNKLSKGTGMNRKHAGGPYSGSSESYGRPEEPSFPTATCQKTANREIDSRHQSIKGKGKYDVPSRENKRYVVGIFSRAAESDYSWLKNLLVKNGKNVESFYIGKSDEKFKKDIDKCRFGILYHSITSGRLNITNVTDSMYDNHLKLMSNLLEKENVMVVLDDLESSNDMERRNILIHQPTIKECAGHLILVNLKEKDTILKSRLCAKANEILDRLSVENSKTWR